jgi:hypothetical protein
MMKAVEDNPFDYVTMEEVSASYRRGGHEVEVMRSKGWFDWHDVSFLLPLGL